MRLAKRINQRVRGSILARAAVALMLGTALTGVAVGVETVAATPAWAQASPARGPSAASDEFNNEYVFWKGTDNNLWEGWYNNYTGTWNGPQKIGMGPLVSEPSVAVSTTQVFAGPGGDEFNGQFVFWQGLNDSLWMAYWEGSWHGPIQLSPSTNGIQAYVCSQPSAAVLDPPSGRYIEIYWKGIATSPGGACSSNLFEAYSLSSVTTNPTAAADYFGPVEATEAGNIGSSPSVAGSYISIPTGGVCLCQVAVSWQGTDGNLWTETYSTGGPVSGPYKDTNSATIGSAPSISGYFGDITPAGDFDIVWEGSGSDHQLWLGSFNATTDSYSDSENISNSGTLGSAPTIAENTYDPDNIYTFWKGSGSSADLWEGFYDGAISNPAWYILNLGMGPLG